LGLNSSATTRNTTTAPRYVVCLPVGTGVSSARVGAALPRHSSLALRARFWRHRVQVPPALAPHLAIWRRYRQRRQTRRGGGTPGALAAGRRVRRAVVSREWCVVNGPRRRPMIPIPPIPPITPMFPMQPPAAREGQRDLRGTPGTSGTSGTWGPGRESWELRGPATWFTLL